MLLKYIKWNKFYLISLAINIILSNMLASFSIKLSWPVAFIIGGVTALIGCLLDRRYSRNELTETDSDE